MTMNGQIASADKFAFEEEIIGSVNYRCDIVYDRNHLFGLGPIPKPKLEIGCNFWPILKLTETVKS